MYTLFQRFRERRSKERRSGTAFLWLERSWNGVHLFSWERERERRSKILGTTQGAAVPVPQGISQGRYKNFFQKSLENAQFCNYAILTKPKSSPYSSSSMKDQRKYHRRHITTLSATSGDFYGADMSIHI